MFCSPFEGFGCPLVVDQHPCVPGRAEHRSSRREEKDDCDDPCGNSGPFQLPERAECATCHTPPVFSNFRFYNAGIGTDAAEPDSGRQQATDNERDFGKFRVPTLRDITDTGPYFHDGSEESLEEAVRLMATGGVDNPKLSMLFRGLQGREYTDEQIADLVAFLGALSGEYPVIEEPELP